MPAIPDNIRAELGDHYDFERELVGGGTATGNGQRATGNGQRLRRSG